MPTLVPAASPASVPVDRLSPAPRRGLRVTALIFPAVLYLLGVFWVLAAALPATRGHLVYALDDTYIHMAIAKNLAAHGVFGVTSHGFVSASSSILWPLLLAGLFKIFGPLAVIPLIAQIAIGIALLWLSWEALNRAGITSNLYAGAALSVLVLTLPMVPMTFVAMEHLLQPLATLLFAMVSVRYLNASRLSLRPVLLCAVLLVAVRYEGLFLVAAVALLCLLQKKLLPAMAVAAAGWVPVTLFGLYSISHGGFFLPNSLLIKARPIGLATLLRLRTMATDCPEVFVLALVALLMLAFGRNARRGSRQLLQLFLITALLHQMFASYRWFYRYEVYLVALGVIAVSIAAWDLFANVSVWTAAALLLLASFLAIPLFMRAYLSFTGTPRAMADIYHQQYQMAQFFRAYYPQGHIALNDIGAVSFYADPYLTDLAGLGSTEIARARLGTLATGDLRYDFLHNAAAQATVRINHVEVVAVYDDWFGFQPGHIPPGWIRAGAWSAAHKTVIGGSIVSFYGVGDENAARLQKNLAAFHPRLPQ